MVTWLARVRVYLGELFYFPDWFGKVSPATLRADAIAGLTGATIVLPQGVAFAAIAGLPPEYGFYTAMVTPIVAALAGSSWHAVSGPTTAISALVFAALAGTLEPGSPAFIQAAIALAFLVGLIQLVLGLARMGVLIDFVSHSVMTGFVAGAAVLIGLSQLRYVVGVDLPRPSDLPAFIASLPQHLPHTDLRSLAIGALALAVGVGVRWWRPAWPNYLLALVVATGLGLFFSASGPAIATIGAVNASAPQPAWPAVGLDTLRQFGSAALAIALVGLLEALSVARAIAIKSRQPIDGNREIIGQGLSNIVGSLFRCYPGSASFTRSGVNVEAGARTPMAAIFAALFLFLILQFVAPWFAFVPTAAMGGVILLVAWRLIDMREIRHIATTSASESSIAAVTFLATLFINLEFSVYIGVMLSFVFFVRGSSRPMVGAGGAPDPKSPTRVFRDASKHGLAQCPQLIFARLDGPLYFGSVESVRRRLREIERTTPQQRRMVFIIKGVGEVDMPGADLLIEEAARRRARGGSMHLVTRTPKTIAKLARFKVMRGLGKDHIHLNKGAAISHIVPTLDPEICASCTARIFLECPPPPQTTSIEPERATDMSDGGAP